MSGFCWIISFRIVAIKLWDTLIASDDYGYFGSQLSKTISQKSKQTYEKLMAIVLLFFCWGMWRISITEHLNMAAMHLASWKTKDKEIRLNRYGTLSMPDFESNLSSKIKPFDKKNIIKHNTGGITSLITTHIKTTILCIVCFIATTMTTKENPAISLFTWSNCYNLKIDIIMKCILMQEPTEWDVCHVSVSQTVMWLGHRTLKKK